MKNKYRKFIEEDANVSSAQKDYVKKFLNRKLKIKIIQTVIFFSFFILWELFAIYKIIDPFIFSSPTRVVKTLIDLTKSKDIFIHLGITLLETFLSFFIVISFGIIISIILWWNKTIADVLDPYLVILNSLPKSALAPVFIVWLGNNMKTIIVAAISVSLFSTIITLYNDFNSVEEDKIKLINTLGGNKKHVLTKIILPANIPSIISIAKVNIGLCLVGVIIGEFLAAKSGLGYLIVYGSQVFKLDLVIMSIIILCIIASFLYKLISILEDKYKKASK